jgi:hypothetical protein
MEFISGTSGCNHIQRVGNLHAHTNLQAILISAAASWQLASYFPPFTHYWAGTFGSSVTSGIPRAAAQGCFTRVKLIPALTVDRRFENPFDAALAAYLHCLRVTPFDLAFIGATVSQECSNKFKILFGGCGGPHKRD